MKDPTCPVCNHFAHLRWGNWQCRNVHCANVDQIIDVQPFRMPAAPPPAFQDWPRIIGSVILVSAALLTLATCLVILVLLWMPRTETVAAVHTYPTLETP